jgi:hypothetical protein
MMVPDGTNPSRTLPQPSHIPGELQDLVIDRLHQDRHALSACSLVCRQWCPRTRVHLFKSIVLGRETQGPNPILRSILETNPELGQYALHLAISCRIDRGTARWIINLLPLFTRVRTVRVGVKVSTNPNVYVKVEDVDPALVIALCTLIAQPSVGSVTLHSIARFPLSHLIPQLYHIKDLALLNCSPEDGDSQGLFALPPKRLSCASEFKEPNDRSHTIWELDGPSDDGPRESLRRLSLAHSQSALEMLLNMPDIPLITLQEVEIDVFWWSSTGMDNSWNKLIALCGTGIKSLGISQTGFAPMLCRPFNFAGGCSLAVQPP